MSFGDNFNPLANTSKPCLHKKTEIVEQTGWSTREVFTGGIVKRPYYRKIERCTCWNCLKPLAEVPGTFRWTGDPVKEYFNKQ